MRDYFKLRCAVFLILTKDVDGKKYILLQERSNTGILDGYFDVSCSGHLEEGETVKQALIREAKEEIGIDIKMDDLIYSSTIHAELDSIPYLLICFNANDYEGDPVIMEEDKCSRLEWFDIEELPDNLDETRKIMINNYQNNNFYSEYGFGE